MGSVENNINFGPHVPEGGGTIDLRYQIGCSSPASHIFSPGMALSAKADIRSAALTSMSAWLDHLDTYHHDVYTWITARTSTQQARFHELSQV